MLKHDFLHTFRNACKPFTSTDFPSRSCNERVSDRDAQLPAELARRRRSGRRHRYALQRCDRGSQQRIEPPREQRVVTAQARQLPVRGQQRLHRCCHAAAVVLGDVLRLQPRGQGVQAGILHREIAGTQFIVEVSKTTC